MARELPQNEPLHYDFTTDRWIDGPALALYRDVAEQPVPKTEPAPGRWHAAEGPLPRPPRWHLPDRSRNVAFTVLILLLCLAPFVVPSLGTAILVPFAAVEALLLILALTTPYRRHLAQPVAEGRDVRLLENPDDLDLCLVEIAIFQNGKVVGRDRGAAWFEGGRILFSGHRTSFAFGGEDLVPRSRRPSRLRLGGELPLRVPSGTASVAFQPLRYGQPQSESRFWTRHGTFAFFTPASRGPRQWPPLTHSNVERTP